MNKTLTARSLEEEVYDAILNEIVSGQLEPGDPLVEAQLSERFGISKTPIREALIRLKRDGLVESALHHKNRVTTPTEDDVRQACEVRDWIESRVTAHCAENPDPKLVARLEESVKKAEKALDAGNEQAYLKAIRDFSDVLMEASGNRYAIRVLDTMNNVLTFIANISRGEPGRRKRSIDEHKAILEAVRSGDPVAAAEATGRHLHSIEKDSLHRLASLQGAKG